MEGQSYTMHDCPRGTVYVFPETEIYDYISMTNEERAHQLAMQWREISIRHDEWAADAIARTEPHGLFYEPRQQN